MVRHKGRTRCIGVLMLVALSSVAALLSASAANAAVIFPNLGQISGPEPGQPFGHLDSNSVAVNDFNNHILVADSSAGLVYDFSSASDTAPKVIDGSSTPAGSFGGGAVSVAVDNASGDFYVADTAHEVIDKFDASGALIESFGDTTPTPNGQLAGTATPEASFAHPTGQTPLSITVDQSTHDLYVIDSGHEQSHRRLR